MRREEVRLPGEEPAEEAALVPSLALLHTRLDTSEDLSHVLSGCVRML